MAVSLCDRLQEAALRCCQVLAASLISSPLNKSTSFFSFFFFFRFRRCVFLCPCTIPEPGLIHFFLEEMVHFLQHCCLVSFLFGGIYIFMVFRSESFAVFMEVSGLSGFMEKEPSEAICVCLERCI
jgi:hypothetical protein